MKTVCYTALAGSYDTLHDPAHVSESWDYICFTDQPLKHHKIWKIKPLKNVIQGDPIRTNRWHKTHPHLLFPDYDASVYIDTNIQITGPHLKSRLNQFEIDNTRLALPLHPERQCAYDEIQECIQTKCDHIQLIQNFEKLLRQENFPHNWGLFENNLIYRKHNHPEMIHLNTEWWSLITQYSRRDQLSLTYLLWKYQVNAELIVPRNETIRNHPGYHYRLHHHLSLEKTHQMKKHTIKILCTLLPISIWRKRARQYLMCKFLGPIAGKVVRESKLAHTYLDGLDGIEIGASAQNGFGLDKTGGSYTTVDFEANQGEKWQAAGFAPTPVDIVANGTDLPFEDDTLDYVLSSHVTEHFFDPIKALKEWVRVVRKGGYIFMIIPHKERTFDRHQPLTSLDELIDRHTGALKINDYVFMSNEEKVRRQYSPQGFSTSDNPHRRIRNNEVPAGWIRFEHDDHHHWSVWTTEEFMKLCHHLALHIVEVQDPDDKIGNGFTIILQKP